MTVSYIDKMQAFRHGDQQTAVLETPGRQSSASKNPLSIDRSYKRWKSLSRDLTRYYEECMISESAKRFTGAGKKKYCARVAWTRLRNSGRYSDYPKFKRNTMAGKSKKKSASAKRRKRDRFGRFLEPATKKTKKRAAKKRGTKKRKTSTTKKSSTRRPVRKATRKTVKKKKAKKSSTRKYTRSVREASPMKRRRRRSVRRTARRSAAREVVYEDMKENPHTPASRKRAGKKAAATRARNKRKAARASGKRKKAAKAGARRRRKTTAIVPSVVKRRIAGHTRNVPGTIRIVVNTPKSTRRVSAKRRSGTTKRRKKSKRGKARSRKGLTRTHLSGQYPQLPSYAGEAYSNPIGALENPLSGGELALAFVSGGVGYTLTDMLDRYLATSKDASATSNQNHILAAPNLARIAAQAGMTAAPFVIASWVRQPMGRAALQGFGLGAGFHLVGQLIKTYIVGKYLKDNTMVKQLMPDTIAAQTVVDAEEKAKGAVSGPPALGNRPYGALAGRNDVGPRAGVGFNPSLTYRTVPGAQQQAPVMSVTVTDNGGGAAPAMNAAPVSVNYSNGQTVPVYQSGSVAPVPAGNCMPCSAESSRAALEASYLAARDEIGACGVGGSPAMKTKPYGSFPD